LQTALGASRHLALAPGSIRSSGLGPRPATLDDAAMDDAAIDGATMDGATMDGATMDGV